ncbi:MAG TPA: ABC transporter permease [Candidatus Limnocylindrales bacterium]|nr:ABC transporter permease [Candidatus Limnocylindrales bacterium]
MSGRSENALLPNAWLIGRREFLERVRSRPFAISTLVLIAIVVGIVTIPLGGRGSNGPVARIGVYSTDAALAAEAVGIVDATVNAGGSGSGPVLDVGPIDDPAAALADARAGRLNGVLLVERDSDGRLRFTYRSGSTASDAATLVSVAALSIAVLDWSRTIPPEANVAPFRMPVIDTVAVPGRSGPGTADARLVGSRLLLGLFFVLLLFIALITYSMWVAQSIAIEKSSRVMELMIGAATPIQLLTGKVVGVGAAGLLQYAAVLVPAAAVAALQGGIRIALGGTSVDPLAGVTIPLLLAYGSFFVLAFLLYALLYAAAASLVNRQEDVQTLAMPLSILSMAGCICGLVALTQSGADWVRALSYVPFVSPFVMLGRILVGDVAPWEPVAAAALLVAAIVVALVVAGRVYSAGVLMYGQRPTLGTFVTALRTSR